VPATISVRDLRKSYADVPAVDGVSFDVQQGEFFGILGPNGAGKTTTLEIIEGLRKPDSGHVTVLGLAAWPRNGMLLPRIGVQLQASSFFERLTAREQIRTFASLYGVPAKNADDMLGTVGLTDQAGVRAEKLSGGQLSDCRSPVPSFMTLSSCFSTSQQERLTRRQGGICGTCCERSATRAGPSC